MDLLENRFIIRQTSGAVWEYFFKNDRIFSKHLIDEKITSEEIVCDMYSDFFVCQDENDNIHMLCQNTNGDITCLEYSNYSWEYQAVLISKVPHLYNKHFWILPCEGILHLFFVINNDDKWMLVHQIKDGNNLSDPFVVDYILLSSSPYNVCSDRSGNIYIFYNKSIDDSVEIVYRKYNAQNSKWEIPSKISSSSHNICPKAIIDRNDFIHVIWLSQNEDSQNIMYQKIGSSKSKNILNEKYIVNTIPEECHNIFLVALDDNIWVVWKDNENIYSSYFDYENMCWKHPVKYDTDNLKNIYSIYYMTNLPNEKKRIKVNNILGDTEGEVKLIIISDLLEISSGYIEESAVALDSPYDVGNISLYLENIKTYFSKIAQKISTLENQKSTLQIEYEEFKKHYNKLYVENNQLKENLTMYDIEIKKLLNQNNSYEKKIANLTELLDMKDSKIKEGSEEIENLRETNLNLTVFYEEKKNKNPFTFLKRFFKILFK